MATSDGRTATGDAHTAVTQELLVRYLDAWTPVALHSARRIWYASDAIDDTALAALRVFGEFTDRLGGRRIALLVATAAGNADALRARLAAVHSELGAPATLAVEVSTGELAPALGPAAGMPVFALLTEPPDDALLAALTGHRNTEVLLSRDTDTSFEHWRAALAGAGLTAAVHVELVDAAGRSRLLVFATATVKHLEKFKDELWAVDEFAGVRYRDPRDDGRTLLDISLSPDLGPLRRQLLRHLTKAGPQSVADLRRFTLQETLYRTADTTRLLTSLVSSGALTREPERGRLTPETLIRPGRKRAA